jgi:hypothetical protein
LVAVGGEGIIWINGRSEGTGLETFRQGLAEGRCRVVWHLMGGTMLGFRWDLEAMIGGIVLGNRGIGGNMDGFMKDGRRDA